MAITLTVSEIRSAFQSRFPSTGNGPGQPTTRNLGTFFHQITSEILGENPDMNMAGLLQRLDQDLDLWKKSLHEHIYHTILGPMLTKQVGSLHSQGREVLNLWQAVQNVSSYLCDLWWEITDGGTKTVSFYDWFSTETKVIREFKHPEWKDTVVVIGNIDAILEIPGMNRKCVMEWKTGKTNPYADMLQACLYHLLLNGENSIKANIALAVISFLPKKYEILLLRNAISDLQTKLIKLIGELAGVTADALVAVEVKPASITNPVGSSKPTISAGNQAASVVNTNPATKAWDEETRDKIIKTLRTFGAPCREMKPPVYGPAFVRFFFMPEKGIRSRNVERNYEDLMLHLGLNDPPAIAINDGMICIDIPRIDRQSISFKQVLPELPELDPLQGNTKIPIGQQLNGSWEWCDLSDSSSAHVLVVGVPGSGKSQWLRTAVASLVATNSPETLELLLIDPKQNAFQFLANSPFLKRNIVTPEDDVIQILTDLVEEMGNRNKEIANVGVQNLYQLNEKTQLPHKRVVCICDEYADLLTCCSSTAERKQLETQFQRLAQVGRAPGFHLILATQYPKNTILSTSIRALLSAKVVLRVTKSQESRVAMDENGAECLLGNGDLYYKCIGKPTRLQGAWLPNHEEELCQVGNSLVMSHE